MPRARSLVAVLVIALFCSTDHAFAESCDKPELTKKQLTEIALREAKARGVRTDQGYDVATLEDQCEYHVLVTLKPYAPGHHFSVRIARNGSVIYFMPGA